MTTDNDIYKLMQGIFAPSAPEKLFFCCPTCRWTPTKAGAPRTGSCRGTGPPGLAGGGGGMRRGQFGTLCCHASVCHENPVVWDPHFWRPPCRIHLKSDVKAAAICRHLSPHSAAPPVWVHLACTTSSYYVKRLKYHQLVPKKKAR